MQLLYDYDQIYTYNNFLLISQVFDADSGRMIVNATSVLPVFTARPLVPGFVYRAFVGAYNSRGHAVPTRLSFLTLKEAELHKSMYQLLVFNITLYILFYNFFSFYRFFIYYKFIMFLLYTTFVFIRIVSFCCLFWFLSISPVLSVGVCTCSCVSVCVSPPARMLLQ